MKLAQAFPEAFLLFPPHIWSHDSPLSSPGRCSLEYADGGQSGGGTQH